nr:integrase, catalytic region, zinc finger, CCHC-type, peptidase aspartic, catalytic [Tanacetum cinerariifolium]
MNIGQDRQMQMVGDGLAKVHENCDDNEIFNMFTQEEQYTELLEPIPESHQVPQNDNDVISVDTHVEQGGETVEQHPANFEETRALYDAFCYPENDREDIGKLGAKGDIGFFIRYSADSCAYKIYNRRTKKIMETMNVSFDELSAMAVEQRSSKPRLQSMTSGQISSGLDLTYAPSTITTQQPSEGELDLLFEAMYDDYICGQPSATGRTLLPAQEPQVRQTSTASTTIADTAPTPTNSSSLATNIPITSYDVDELNSNAMVDGNTFVNPFANSSTSAAASSSLQNVDPSNMHTFYQPYPHKFQWTKDHPLEQDTSKNTKFAKQPIVENLSKVGETNALSKPVTSNYVSTPQESKGMNNDKVIAPGMFRVNPFKTSREEKHVPNKWGNILITRVYFVDGLGHSLFSVGQFCDSDLEVAFRRDACFIRNLEGVDLLKGDRSTNLYTINLHEMASASPICLMARASSTKSWNIFVLHVSKKKAKSISSTKTSSKFEAEITSSSYGFVWTNENCQYKWKANDREDIGKLGAKGDISFFIGYSADSCAYRIYNRRTKKIMETMNVSFDEVSAMAFEQHSLKPILQSELELLFEAMYDYYIGGQLSATGRTVPPAQEPQVRQSSTASTTIADIAPIPTNSYFLATNIPIPSQDVDELNSNAMVDGNTFVNPFAISSTSAAASSSSQNVDPSNMHTFYQPYPHEFQWTKDHPLEQLIGDPSRPVLTRNQLRSDGDMCLYALTVCTMEPTYVKEAMTDPAWIDSMQEELL